MATAATKKPKPVASKKPAPAATTPKAAATEKPEPAAATPEAAATKKLEPAASTQLTCPECDKAFTRPAALGAHRQRAHGIAGTSQNARSRRTTKRRATTQTTARPATTSASNGAGVAVDHDALLRALFPAGIPPRQDIIVAVNDWLSQADTLARQR